MATQHQSTLDGMPKQFVSSLKVLFDILDEEKSGLVRFSDIESRWKDGEVSGLPNGVVEALKKVTPASGKLTFERFVAGLKIALLRNKGNPTGNSPKSSAGGTQTGGLGPKPDLLSHNTFTDKKNSSPKTSTVKAPNTADFAVPLPQPSSNKNFAAAAARSASHKPTTAAVRPNNAVVNQSQRSVSLSAAAGVKDSSSGFDPDMTPPPALPSQPPPSAPPLRNDPFLQDPPALLPAQPRTEPRRATPPITWQPTQSQYNDPYNNRGINTQQPVNQHSNRDAQGRNKDDIVFALKKWQQSRVGGPPMESGNRLTDDQRLQALGRTGPSEGRASIALASFDNYGESLIGVKKRKLFFWQNLVLVSAFAFA